MSARHTRDWTVDPAYLLLYEGHAWVPSMGWVASVYPGGRHRYPLDETSALDWETAVDLCLDGMVYVEDGMVWRLRKDGPPGSGRIIVTEIRSEMALLNPGSCAWLAPGFCGASVDGYCVGGRADGRCFG